MEHVLVRNNPINAADPTGKWEWHDFTEWLHYRREAISNWWEKKWEEKIPQPSDKYDAVPALQDAGLSSKDAQEIGNPQARWAKARSEAAATISDEATEEVMSWAVGKTVGMASIVIFGHGARHLARTVLRGETKAVEAAIKADIEATTIGASQTGSIRGRVTVNGQVVEYRAFTLPDGTINVGTYYTPKP